MPLRAKVLSWQVSKAAEMSTASANDASIKAGQTSQERLEAVRELPGDEADDVVFSSLYGLRTIQLNRPKKLNSLNASMIRKIVPRLREWEKSDMANVVVMKGAGDKAFCAGGDVAALALHNQAGDWRESARYFAMEYQLDHYIATYKKPYVAVMDGITMGGGVGLSVHAPFRIATERTVFAMPETTIGFFPDVGASFFLPRLDGAVGTYLGLTSERLAGANVFYSGVATHYLHSTSLNALESRLAELRFRDYDDLPARLRHVGETLDEFATGLPHDQPMLLAGELREAIDRCFSRRTVPDIIAALEAERGATEEWARKTIETLHKRSPTSVYVTLKQLQGSRAWTIRETFMREYEMAKVFMRGHDFTEGVSALLIRKEPAKWQPARLEDIKASDRVEQPYLEPRAAAGDEADELGFFNETDYSEYPHTGLGVPTEAEVRARVLRGKTLTAEEVRGAVVASRGGRQGVAEVVDEILRRKVTTDGEGRIRWVD